MYLNGQVLTNKPLSERINILESVVNPIEGRVEFTERKIGRTRSEVCFVICLLFNCTTITISKFAKFWCRFQIAPNSRIFFSIPSQSQVVDAVNLAIDRREEGIILKEQDSVYKPAMRSRSGWVKIKPEYSNELMDQVTSTVS